MSNTLKASNTPKTKSLDIDLEMLQKTIKQIYEYFNTEEERDVALTSLLNWFRVEDEGSVFKKFLIDRLNFAETLGEAISNRETGRAHDSMILSVANDLLAQIEMAASFRRLKPAHHFAKARNNINFLGHGALSPMKSKAASVLEEYTSIFMENAQDYTAK